MKVLFLLITPPDLAGYSDLYSDLVLEFANNGHDVHVATLLEKRHGRESRLETKRGVKVLHVAGGDFFGVGVLRKGLTTISLTRRFITAIDRFFKNERFDLVIYNTPPITFSPVVRRLKRKMGCKTYLILRDIFPANARDLGMIRDPLTFHFFRRLEKQLYQISDRVGCMSQGNIDYVLAHNPEVPRSKLELLPNWMRVSPDPPIKDPQVLAQHGLAGKFLALYSGNIGYSQELEFLLELAKLYRDRDDIVFMLIGKGAMTEKLKSSAARAGLSNVIFRDFILERADFERLLASADLGLINLDRRFTIPNIPSKTLGYFACGVPILAAIDRHTDYGQFLDDCHAGLWSLTGDLPAYQHNFERLLSDPHLRKTLGQNGRAALIERFTVEKAYQTIAGHFEPAPVPQLV